MDPSSFTSIHPGSVGTYFRGNSSDVPLILLYGGTGTGRGILGDSADLARLGLLLVFGCNVALQAKIAACSRVSQALLSIFAVIFVGLRPPWAAYSGKRTQRIPTRLSLRVDARKTFPKQQ